MEHVSAETWRLAGILFEQEGPGDEMWPIRGKNGELLYEFSERLERHQRTISFPTDDTVVKYIQKAKELMRLT